MAFELPALSYAYDALEPHIDARTMEIHHSKHHNGYTTNLNNAIADTPLADQSIEEILKNLDLKNKAVRNNGGGYYNHRLFWEVMSPEGAGLPSGSLATAIDNSFGSFEEFKSAKGILSFSLSNKKANSSKSVWTSQLKPCCTFDRLNFKSNWVINGSSPIWLMIDRTTSSKILFISKTT